MQYKENKKNVESLPLAPPFSSFSGKKWKPCSWKFATSSLKFDKAQKLSGKTVFRLSSIRYGFHELFSFKSSRITTITQSKQDNWEKICLRERHHQTISTIKIAWLITHSQFRQRNIIFNIEPNVCNFLSTVLSHMYFWMCENSNMHSPILLIKKSKQK